MTRGPRLLMAGSFGFGNTGDDAILATMIRDLREQIPGVELTVATGNPAETQARHAVATVHWHDIHGLVAAARTCDLVTLGGGGLFYDYWGFDPVSLLTPQHTELAYYTEFALLAALLDKPLMIYAAGVGPLLSEAGRSFTRIAFEQAVAATVRDRGSQALLASLGVDGTRVTADPAFGFRGVDAAAAREAVAQAAGGELSAPCVGVVLREWDIGVDGQAWEREVAAALDAFGERHGGMFVFIPFQSVPGILTQDSEVAERVRARMRHPTRGVVLAQDVAPETKAGVLATCHVVLGMRLHAVIFAMAHGVPAVALPYDPKVADVLTFAEGDVPSLALRDVTSARLGALLEHAYHDRAAIAARLQARAPRLAALGRENARIVAELVATGAAPRRPLPAAMEALIRDLGVRAALRVLELQHAIATSQSRSDECVREGRALEAHLREAEQRREADLRALSARLAEREHAFGSLAAHVGSITGSRAWKVAQALSRLRWKVIPPGSRRERVLWKPTSQVSSAPIPAEPAAATPAPAAETSPGVLAQGVAGATVDAPRPGQADRARARGQARRRVAILTNRVLDWDSRAPTYGGGERYCMMLSALLRSEGLDVTVFQLGSEAFEAERDGIRVVALPGGAAFSEFQPGVCDAFTHATREYDHVVHNLPEYASGTVRPDALVICHGIWFDHDNYGDAVAYRTAEWFGHLHRVFAQPAKVVSVDTGSINVVRALWPAHASRMTYIPNWVDTALFHPGAQATEHRAVLFPRRSQVNRGSRMMEAILARVQHDWRFLWVGEGDAEDTRLLRDLATRDARLAYHAATFDEMPAWYRQADVCVIPTVAAEGTSLACLEGLASGNAVVATHVGGLGNLVQPGLNGLLVDPTPDAIAAAINHLIEHPQERRRWGEAGRRTAEGFGLPVWQGRWRTLLRELGWIGGTA